jgi:hypothetical protein
MDATSRFVWFLGSGSQYNDEEIRYSMRSVAKFHPEAQMVIIGERPEWYTGEHYYISDESDCAYVNKWRKMENACLLFDTFVAMDDDFYLLEPFRPAFYYSGKLSKVHNKYRGQVGKYTQMVIATCDIVPESNNYFMHAPLPIDCDEFRRISEHFPQRKESPGLSARQIYATNAMGFETIQLERDVKIHGEFDALRLAGMPFFSIHNNFRYLKALMESLYPTPTTHERDCG